MVFRIPKALYCRVPIKCSEGVTKDLRYSIDLIRLRHSFSYKRSACNHPR